MMINLTEAKTRFALTKNELFGNSFKKNLFYAAAVFAIFTAGIALPATREMTLWMLSENSPVETLTVIMLVFAGIIGLFSMYKMNRAGERKLHQVFYFLFSFGLLLTAMEEIAWGQQIWKFETPSEWREINMQGETTIHNIKGLHGNTEYLRLIFGLGGIAGVFLNVFYKNIKIAAPIILLPWFIAISSHAVVDVWNDLMPIQKEFDAVISWLAELVELLIAATAFFYICLNARKAGFFQRRLIV